MEPSIELQLQIASEQPNLPAEAEFKQWIMAALGHLEIASLGRLNLCIRIVDEDEITKLNKNYRNKNSGTNVLSFPQDLPDSLSELSQEWPLGDIVLCAPIVDREANEQGKPAIAHWAHLTVHGLLHLLDYEHENDKEAAQMESIEIAILDHLGFASPY